ncbi:MAG: hypothetical protein ACE5E6_11005 [Phycisphaerae bacterium]
MGILIVALVVAFIAGRKYGMGVAKDQPVFVPNLPELIEPSKHVTRKRSLNDPYKILVPTLTKHEYDPPSTDFLDYEHSIIVYLAWDTSGLKKETLAAKGDVLLCDARGNTRATFGIGLDRSVPNTPFESVHSNRFDPLTDDGWLWVATTKEKMTVRFRVSSIVYVDGTREDFD